MGSAIQPEAPWQLAKKPHEWQQVLLDARRMLQANPNDADALEAIEDANEALSVYDQAEAAGGFERLRSGLGGAVGLAESGLDAVVGALRLPISAVSGAVKLARDPEGTLTDIDEGFNATMERLKQAASNPIQTLEEATPREIGYGAGVAGMAALPFAKAGSAGSFTRTGSGRGILADRPELTGPSVGGVAGELATRPFRAVGSALNIPIQKSALLREQALTQATRRAGLQARTEQLLPKQVQAADLRSQLLGSQLERQPTILQNALDRVKLIEQQLERGGPTLENLELRNELLKLKLSLQEGATGGTVPPNPLDDLHGLTDEALEQQPLGKTPPIEQSAAGQPGIPEPLPTDIVQRELQRTPPVQFETHGPGGSPLPPVSPSRFIGPGASAADIEAYLRQITQALQSGYPPLR